MNHDATHCLDYKKSCPKSCYRAQLTKELKEIDYTLPVSWMHYKGTKECPKERGEREASRHHHYVKILPKYYIAVEKGIKTFEIRFNDRNYKVGDILHLQEFYGDQYTSRELTKEICYMIDDPDYCKEGFVVLGIK